MDRVILNTNGNLQVIVTGPADRIASNPRARIVKIKDSPGHVRQIYEQADAIDYLLNPATVGAPMPELSAMDQIHMMSKGTHLPFEYALTDPLGVPPHKTRVSDSGFDLSLVAKRKVVSDTCVVYGTGVAVCPPAGFYFDLVPRSSFASRCPGYVLANSVGIIDQGYTGEIMVMLMKVDPDAPDVQLPCKCVQLIPRQWFPLRPTPVDNKNFRSSDRGAGGFGSTDLI